MLENKRYFTPETVGQLLTKYTEREPDLFTCAVFAAEMERDFIEQIAAGAVPVYAAIDGDTARIRAMFSEADLRTLWRQHSSLTESEMTEAIKNSGLYGQTQT